MVTDSATLATGSGELPDEQLRELLKRVGNRDQKAMEAFYRATHSRVFRFARSRLNDSFAAADILHETMIEVWKNAGRFRGASKTMTWVLGIAHHKVIDLQRKQTRDPVTEADETMPDTESPTPADLAERSRDRERLDRCLSRLSEKHRSVLHLVFFQDMPYGEIATVMGCPEGTVKTRVFHAKEALKKCLTRLTS
jgi:RNA polymerase sigma-70 factor (ECF subfamily)